MNRTILLVVLSSVFLFMFCKEKITEPKIRIASASGGLNMRDKPDASGTLVATIPDWVKVEAFEEAGNEVTIGGVAGKWTRVKWNDKTGWVFGGFLKPGPVSQYKRPDSGSMQPSTEEYKKKKDMYLKLVAALHAGKTDQMTELLKAGADPNFYPLADNEKGYEERYEPLLIKAASGCSYEQARVLMEYGAYVNIRKNYSESFNPDESILSGISPLDIVTYGMKDYRAKIGCTDADAERQKFINLLKKSGGEGTGVNKLWGLTR